MLRRSPRLTGCGVRAGVGEVLRQSYWKMAKTTDLAFKAFAAGLGITTIYLGVTFSVNVYRGLSWHNAQSKLQKEASTSQRQ